MASRKSPGAESNPIQQVHSMLDLMMDAVLIFGFPLGVLVGYQWRSRISEKRWAQHLANRDRSQIRRD
jgi:hypothetical protein